MTYPETRLELGAIYSPEETVFRIWAPVATSLSLHLYDEPTDIPSSTHQMTSIGEGCFECRIKGDLASTYYRYQQGNDLLVDPYALGTALNSTHGVVIDLKKTNPPGFLEHRVPRLSYKDAIIYETHIRDFTVDPEANFEKPGTFLGFFESKKLEGKPIGIDHVVEMGFTHVHLLPIQDFVTVDEIEGGYNWGYDPELYFNLEGSYAHEKDPHQRIKEFKELVQHLHKKGLGVVMDVVYNHTYRSEDSVYSKLAPGYFYRMDQQGNFINGSGTGNEIDSERPMVGRLIIESLEYFAREFQVDGFRFDLLGIMDIERTREIIRRLRRINPNILIYGEPWGGGPSGLAEQRMTLKGSQKRHEFALFNDNFRDALKGRNDDESLGYAQGNILGREGVLSGITGSIEFSDQIRGFTHYPHESINYHSSHDNLILYDKLKLSLKSDDEHIMRVTKLTFSMLLLSFGIPFIHAGTEFMRTKQGHHNTYNLGDEVNTIRWSDKLKWMELSQYVKELITLRKRIDAFGYYNDEQIREKLIFLYNHIIIAYTLELGDDEFSSLLVAHNPTPEEKKVPFNVKDGVLLFYDGKKVERPYQKENIKPFSSMVVGIKK